MGQPNDDDIKAVFEQMRGSAAGPAPAGGTPPPSQGPAAGAPRPRATFTDGLRTFAGISPRAWEHPADRAALTALRKVPGFDQVMRRVFGLVSDKSLRLLFLANTVKVGPTQCERVYAALQDCLAVLDAPYEPDLFIAQTPLVNAGAIGIDEPFIVLNSGTVELLDDDELRFVIGHELGHALSGHALYKTMLAVILRFTVFRMGLVTGMIRMGLFMALQEWSRKSELSADRAGLLCLQDPQKAYRVHMKMAGGNLVDQMNLDAFIAQAEGYTKDDELSDGVFKLMNLLGKTHPFPALRLVGLKRWVDAGAYGAVLAGDYPHREADRAEGTVYDDVAASVGHYRESMKEGTDSVSRLFGELGQGLSEASSALWDQMRDLFRKGEDGGDAAAPDDATPGDDAAPGDGPA